MKRYSPVAFNKFLKMLDGWIKVYSESFNLEAAIFCRKTNNEPYLEYERTLSSIANYYAYKLLKLPMLPVLSPVFVANEFAIRFKNGINAEDYSSLRNEVGLRKDVGGRDWKNYCVVDGFFRMRSRNSPQEEPDTLVFVEYKLQHDFVYLDLAIDYLKYKAYTYNGNGNTVFVYVVFDKGGPYPTILSEQEPYYLLLDDTINCSVSTCDKRVFVHLPNETKQKTPIEKVEKTIELFDEMKTDSKTLESNDDGGYSEEEKAIINALHKYDSRVIKSSKIRSNYFYIKDLWEKANEKNVFGSLTDFYETKNGAVTIEDIVKAGSEYRDNLVNFTGFEVRADAYKKGVRGSNYTSLFLIAFLEFFKKYYGIDGPKPSLGTKRIGRNEKNSTVVQDKQVVDYFLNNLEKHYHRLGDVEKERRLKRIAHSTMYFVTKLYPLIYDIDEAANELKEKKQYRVFEALNNMQHNINKALKQLKIKKKINLERIVYHKDEEEIASLNELFVSVIKEY